mmetsp:Transcript_76492/g.216269  ORF Transcript_76492/g.216269 Transcript_76492/m.216269 type:complete len:137 (-) Transcript_76492:115-525(-)|eukprot:CAMPEP_0179260450 /NCGR_PEP_ID=MMETSP0797-20121207/26346_1 /TAXON_ID=47934 /ORGANISM="Dinophysis acuminata, Strain DAEP01" /LENGTH=136 /DNA_ID=CAMNT_0020968531 /DNA_START=170 /DNA_END=580 /DNA_ORIENTATION=+
MLPTLHGGSELCGSDIIMAVRPNGHVPLWPREGEVVIMVDKRGRMVKRLRKLQTLEGAAAEIESNSWSGLQCWIEGDNPGLSEDSRYFGWVSSDQLVAVALAVVWPPWRWSWLLERGRLAQVLAPARADEAPRGAR